MSFPCPEKELSTIDVTDSVQMQHDLKKVRTDLADSCNNFPIPSKEPKAAMSLFICCMCIFARLDV